MDIFFFDNIDDNINETQLNFKNLIYNGTLKELIHFYNKNKDNINLSYRNEEPFLMSCKQGNIDIIKWLLEEKQDINIIISNEFAFMTACSNGYLEIAQFIYEKYKIMNYKSEKYELAFINSCRSNNIELPKWLLTIKPDINISIGDEWAFRNACTFGKLDIAKWLLQIKPNIDIVIRNNYSFCFSCIENQIEIVKWLLEIKPDIYISYYNETIFPQCSKWGLLDIMKLLYQKNPLINNYVNFNICFYIACKHNNIDIIYWLLQIRPDIDTTFNNNKAFYKVCNYKNINFDLIKLFLDKNPTMINTIDSTKINKQSKEYILSLGYIFPLKWIDIIKLSNNLIDCPICSEEINEYVETPCNHKFCKPCIERWIETNSICPCCRYQV